MKSKHCPIRFTLLILALFIGLSAFIFTPKHAVAQQIPSPESFFGFEMGADRKLARWDKLVEYYRLLGSQSPRLKVVDM